MAKYFFDQLDKGKARRDAQKAQNQAVLANLIKMKQADDAQIKSQSNQRFMQEYGFDYDETKQDDAQGHDFGILDDKQGHDFGILDDKQSHNVIMQDDNQSHNVIMQDDAQKHQLTYQSKEHGQQTSLQNDRQTHDILMQDDRQTFDLTKQSKDFDGRKMLQDDSQAYDAIKQEDAQTHDLKKLEKQAGYSMAELDKKLTAEEKNLTTRLNHDMEVNVLKEGGLNNRQTKSIANDLHKFYKSNAWKKEAEKTKRENNVVDALFALDIESKQKAKDFKFIANPFLLGKMTNMLGLNYKEGAVLDKVENNLPALTEAVNIARNLPNVELKGIGGLLGGMQQDPRKQQLISVLMEYKEHLDQKGDRFWNPTSWKNESDAMKTRASNAEATINGLLQLVSSPQAPIDPNIYLDRIK